MPPAEGIINAIHLASHVRASCTTRSLGNLALHTGEDPGRVEDRRARLKALAGVDRIQWLNQVHGAACFHADAATARQAPQADAVWTDVPGLALAVLTADCVPVVVVHASGTAVGIAHGGWRGLERGVLKTLIDHMGVTPDKLVAWIGPSIDGGMYEVGEDVWGRFVGLHADALRPHDQNPAKRLLDLSRVASNQLIRAGVSRVVDSNLRTGSDERFYTFRHGGGDEEKSGRFATLVFIEPDRA